MNLAFKYFRLQQIDSQIDRARSRLEGINTRLADRTEIDQARVELESAAGQLEAKRGVLQFSEQETSALREKIKLSERQLYGGQIHNPKELQDLQREVESLNRHLEALEERQFEAMVSMDEAQNLATARKRNLDDIQAVSVERNSTLLGEKSSLESELARLDEERQAAAHSLDGVDLEAYERLRRSKKGVAVAQVVEKNCSACGSTLTAGLIQTAQSPNDITHCPTCSRILYAG
ncbi:MAG TPA: C4-type zinc ribbon domain-containing protein [Anaerolineales bacterium]|nr:C4-type zinc ribbon domain-containing protein [Anaerolineales bacterium]